MIKKIAVFNEKGGVGKTTTSVFLGNRLAAMGYTVLLVDLDQHAGMSHWLSVKPSLEERTISHVLLGGLSLQDTAVVISKDISLVPANYDIGKIDPVLSSQPAFEYRLRENMGNVKKFDFIIFDCPPNLNATTLNTLIVTDLIIIPTQVQYLSVISAIKYTIPAIKMIRKKYKVKPKYKVLVTMYDQRINNQEKLMHLIKENLDDHLFSTIIGTSAKVQEYQINGFRNAQFSNSSGVVAEYGMLAKEILIENVSQNE
ncbi:MAG: ParA family protein [Anaerolineales bacterium]|nr:ParA family protein [Anaerolineales bacterium]